MRAYLLIYCDPNSYQSHRIIIGVFGDVSDAVDAFKVQHSAVDLKYIRGYAAGWAVEEWDGRKQGRRLDMQELVGDK